MPHKTCTFTTGEKVVEKVLPTRTKWKKILLDVNAVGKKASLELILLWKLSAIKNAFFREYIIKKQGNKYAQCSNCKKLKCLRDAHTMGTKSYASHQLNYFKHVNMQEAHTIMIITQIEPCPFLGPWRSLLSSMTKSIMSKQCHHVLQIESKPRMDFLSFMYWLQVILGTIASHTPNTTLFVFCVGHGNIDVHKMDYLKMYINPLYWHCRMIAHGHGDVKFAHYVLD